MQCARGNKGTSADRAHAPAKELQKMTTTTTRRTAARSAALASVKAIAITVAVVLAGTLVFALLGSHIVPDFTGPFAQERYGEVVEAGGGVVQGAAEHASQLGEQADSIASGHGEDGSEAESGTDLAQPTPQPEAPLAIPSSEQGRPEAGQAEVRQQEEQDAEPPLPVPIPPPAEPIQEEAVETDTAPEPPADGQPAPDGCSGRPAGWPGCPDGSTQETGEFIASQLETRPPTDPEEIAANAEASGSGASGGGASRDEILARANAAKNPAPRDAAPPTAIAGSVTRIVDGDTLAISGVAIDLSLVAAHPDRHDDATRHTRQACPVGSTASYVPDTGRDAASPDGTQRAKVWCFGPDNTPASKSLNQELAEHGLAGASAGWQACKGSSFYKEPWAQAVGC